MNNRQVIQSANNWVVKIGSALITRNGQGLAHDNIQNWVTQLSQMKAAGKNIVVVSSGAISEGVVRLKLSTRPKTLHGLQAAAAVGQMGLAEAWASAFAQHDICTAQILLTHDDLANRRRYLNARNTLKSLLEMDVVPIVNENDTVATDEIRFGDNDSLGALVANLVDADILTILTDQQGLFNTDPRNNPDAKLISKGNANDDRLANMAGKGGMLGRGGMITKISAAKQAARSGTHTLIASGWEDQVLSRLANKEQLGTLLLSSQKPMTARKQWLASHLHVMGTLVLVNGTVKILQKSGEGLRPINVIKIIGEFQRGDLVSCVNESGLEIARGLTNFNSTDANKIKQQTSDNLLKLLGYSADSELIHKNNLIIN